MKKVKKVFSSIINILLVLILVFAGFVFISSVSAGKGKVPQVFGYSFLRVESGSMEPTIPVGSMIIVHKIDPAEVQVGDVITFYSPDPALNGMPNTHRVVELIDNGGLMFVTRGDAGYENDPYSVSADRLVGIYQKHFQVKNLYGILHSPYFFFFAVLVPLMIVIFFEVLHFKKTAEEKEAKKHEKDSSDQ